MEKERESSSDDLTSEDCVRILRDLVEWKSLDPPDPDDPCVDGLLHLIASKTYGGLIREGFVILYYDPSRRIWYIEITDEGLEEWRRRIVQ